LLIAECGLKKKTLKSEIRNWKSEIGGPMLFGHNGLPSGPQNRFSADEKEPKGGQGSAFH
jgi:hypothetical protein